MRVNKESVSGNAEATRYRVAFVNIFVIERQGLAVVSRVSGEASRIPARVLGGCGTTETSIRLWGRMGHEKIERQRRRRRARVAVARPRGILRSGSLPQRDAAAAGRRSSAGHPSWARYPALVSSARHIRPSAFDDREREGQDQPRSRAGRRRPRLYRLRLQAPL